MIHFISGTYMFVKATFDKPTQIELKVKTPGSTYKD